MSTTKTLNGTNRRTAETAAPPHLTSHSLGHATSAPPIPCVAPQHAQNAPIVVTGFPTVRTPNVGESVMFPGGISVTLEIVSPAKAAAYLEKNHKDNRNCTAPRRNRITSDMATGRFCLTHQGIALDENDVLVDGQTRLRSVVASGVSVTMFVFRGLKSSIMPVLDTGTSRTTQDAIRVAGDAEVTHYHLSTLRAMVAGVRGKADRRSSTQELERYAKYRPVVTWATGIFPIHMFKTYFPATVRGVLARASYTQPKEKLEEFARKLVMGEITDPVGDSGIVRLREYLIKNGGDGSSVANKETYGKARRALKGFLDGEKLDRLHAHSSDELFDLPD